MTEKAQENYIYKGSCYRIVRCRGAYSSFKQALPRDARKADRFKNKYISFYTRFGDGFKLARGTVVSEGDLPKGSGNFWAFKKIPVRAYFWHSRRYPNTVFISHYVWKDWDNLRKSDAERVCNNWYRIEENGDER